MQYKLVYSYWKNWQIKMVTDERRTKKSFLVQFDKNTGGQTIASTYAEKQQQIPYIFGSQMFGNSSFWSMTTMSSLLMMELEVFYF